MRGWGSLPGGVRCPRLLACWHLGTCPCVVLEEDRHGHLVCLGELGGESCRRHPVLLRGVSYGCCNMGLRNGLTHSRACVFGVVPSLVILPDCSGSGVSVRNDFSKEVW